MHLLQRRSAAAHRRLLANRDRSGASSLLAVAPSSFLALHASFLLSQSLVFCAYCSSVSAYCLAYYTLAVGSQAVTLSALVAIATLHTRCIRSHLRRRLLSALG